MKKEFTTSQWLLYKGALALTSIIFSCALYFVIYGGSLQEVQSLINHGDVIYIHRLSIAAVGGIPICIYCMLAPFRDLFKKGIKPSKKQSKIGLTWGLFSVITTSLGILVTFLLPFGFMFSSYSNCPQENLGAYYVTNLKLCETITTNILITNKK